MGTESGNESNPRKMPDKGHQTIIYELDFIAHVSLQHCLDICFA